MNTSRANLLSDARAYGAHLAEMLAASHFSAEEKQAWAELVPLMTPTQLGKFDALLQDDMQAEVRTELEDLFVTIKAALHQRDLSLVAIQEQAHQDFDAVEKELEQLSK
jgi:hypothetical protein